MDEERRIASLTAFYFGRKVARAPHRDEVIKSAAYKAYPDVRRTIWGMASHPLASELKEATRDKIVSFVHSLEDIRSQEQFDQQHQAWCEDVVAYYQAHPHRDRPSFQFHYGHAQKWLNMTLKYLAVLGHPTVEGVYDFLHAPVDRDVYARAESLLGVRRPKAAWSRLDGGTYLDYQVEIRRAIQEQDGRCVMDWETDEWIAAR